MKKYLLFNKVTANKQWAEIGRELGIDSSKYTGVSTNLKSLFIRWIQPYEQYIKHDGKLTETESDSDGFENISESTSTDYSDSFRESETETDEVAHMSLRNGNGDERPKRSSRLKRNTKIEPVQMPTALQMKRLHPMKRQIEKSNIPSGNELCKLCSNGRIDGEMILCAMCDHAFHLSCIELPEAPSNWNCIDCYKSHGKDFGFQDSQHLRTLSEFQEYADTFKKRHFKKLGETQVDEYNVEREFWRLTGCYFGDLDVEYGADLHSSTHGRYESSLLKWLPYCKN